jgi:hypothetical protein
MYKQQLTVKNTVVWNATPCSLEVQERFGWTYCEEAVFGPEDGSSTFFRNVGKLIRDYTASHHIHQRENLTRHNGYNVYISLSGLIQTFVIVFLK